MATRGEDWLVSETVLLHGGLRDGGLSGRTAAAAGAVLAGRGRGWRSLLPFAGPAVVASVAYVDPGNFATNIQAGSAYGYMLLWVVVAANLIAMLFQGLSAKLGIVTGHSLADLCRLHFPRKLVIFMWLASEVAAMATDLAEFMGGAIGLSLLFGIPLMAGLAITAVLTYALLLLTNRGFRPIELAIGGMVGVIGVCYLLEMFLAPIDWAAVGIGSVVPRLGGSDSVVLAVAIIGSTVMPHAIYLHSNLTRDRVRPVGEAQTRRLVRYSWREVYIALGIAGLVNIAMLAMAAATFHAGFPRTAEIGEAYRTLTPLLGAAAAGVFLVSLLASGLSSSAVGTMAGQAIMTDFVRLHLPIWARRAITMVPSFVVVGMGVEPTRALVISQVVLSLVLPLPVLALLWMVGQRRVMGAFVSGPLTRLTALAAAVLVLALNAMLLVRTFSG